ncbi:acidic fibroblast growth factor intracellular [Schistosoma japonicum]|uniref:Acidic fibroblast growth factor intracellular n=1 Tax=Schistosoma japonicum TaxID=6182 RepID=A0A4Z2CN09_SCHJA|nr:acidic fibroblast growth factor intracellular [Schistosoma japonicum]TNN05435.1 acidic fibroblast growth factor intracellular [Schistosoma japonicum]
MTCFVNAEFGYCEAIDLCSKYCDKVGTRKCDIIQGRYFCICRPTHMGLNCSYTRDPCVELASNVHMSGNSACNVANGGVCWGTLGTNTYHCQCPASFTSDPFYSFSNCLQVRDQCASTICIHGDCVSSKDGQEAHCICHEEAYGKYCEFTRGQWAQWSPWSECSPNCGLHNHQKRIRTRDCLGEACSGGLGYLHMEFCDIQPCSNEILMLNRLNSSEDIEKLKLQVLQIESTRYIEMSSRLAKYLLLITCVLSAAVATAITLVVYCA